MDSIFADRINDVPKSFIREILKVGVDPDIISFAGGLPNRDLFPIDKLKDVCNIVFEDDGKDALQYNNSEGYLPLRQYISQRYKDKNDLNISPENILITNGSQQGLDLIAKTLLNEKDHVVIEEPGYLGAIQALSIYKPVFHPIQLTEDGLNIEMLKSELNNNKVKIIYGVPNFQNPSGITYSLENRKSIAQLIKSNSVFFVEDDPYREIRFLGEEIPPIKKLCPDNTILLGSFSKIIVPGFRIGWIASPDNIMDKLLVAKQASDLHTNSFLQRVIFQYLDKYGADEHIKKIIEVYEKQRNAMVKFLEDNFPEEVKFTQPKGGMFLWIELPEELSAMQLFEEAIKEKVAFVPGNPFYVNDKGKNTLRLNYSCVDEKTIEIGMSRLLTALNKIL